MIIFPEPGRSRVPPRRIRTNARKGKGGGTSRYDSRCDS
jgi:hypothetical protein